MLLAAAAFLLPSGALAANPVGGLQIEPIVAYNLVVDSNIQTPAGRSPTAAFIGVKFCNTGTNVLTNVVAYTGLFASNSPGTFAITYTNKPGPGLSPFSLTFEGGSSGKGDATRRLGVIHPGECMAVYWLVTYPLKDSDGNAVHGPSVKPDDDLRLFYDIWATAKSGSSIVTANVERYFNLRNEITAMANKILPNNANKVPQEYLDLLQKYVPTWTNTPYDGSVGTRIFTEGYWYDLGVINQGFDNNGDLVPDYNAWMQPVGDASRFDASCFRLVKTYAMVVLKGVTVGTNVYIVEDQLYFENMPLNSGAIGLVLYEFLPLKPNCYSMLTPYQEVASGFDNEKFNADFGAGFGFWSGTQTVIITKGASEPTVIPGSNISYYVTYTNFGHHTVGSLELGTPIVISDSIPSGTYYIAGSATNYNVLPTNVPYYVVLFSTNHGATWQATEPTNPTNVTDVQWWLEGGLESNAWGQIGFDVQVPEDYLNSSPYVCNTACVGLGDADPFACAEAVCTLIGGTNRLGDTVWADDGTGGGYLGNQIQEVGEPGLSNITVWLYWDGNTNGVVDGSDMRVGTNVTGAAGYYLFTNLLDGMYIAVVDWLDSDLPYGYTLTTPGRWWADLDHLGTNTNAVAFLTADYGFAPALLLDKSIIGSTNLYAGRQVTFPIAVSNNIQGTGGTNGSARMYNVWANAQDVTSDKGSGSGTGNKAWQNITNAWIPPYPDGIGAIGPFDNAGEMLALMDFRLPPQAGSITSVYVVLPIVAIIGTFGADTFDTALWKNGSQLWSTSIAASAITLGDLMFNVTTVSNWTWADFNSTNLTIKCTTQKAGNPTVELHVDCFGFRIWGNGAFSNAVDSTTLDPVPLTDRYPTNVLQYSSAIPTPTYVTNDGTALGIIYWDNVGPIYPGGTSLLWVTFNVLQPPGQAVTVVTNYAMVTNATFVNGVPANNATDQVPVQVRPTGQIGDFVWRDLDRDGVQDGTNFGEVGIGNVRVVLLPPTNIDVGAGVGVPITNLTDDTGYYIFKGIPSTGSYTVRVDTTSLPSTSFTNTYDEDSGTNAPNNQTVVTNLNPTSTSLWSHLTADFGYSLPASIDGHVWHDRNRSGTSSPDPGEEWITNVVVYLFRTNNMTTPVATNFTDANGYFLFSGQQYTGTWAVVVATNVGALSNGWYQSFDTDGTSTAHRVTVTVPLGGSAHADYSYYKLSPYVLGDTIFYDWDGNGVQDTNTEEGIYNIPVYLYVDRNTNGILGYVPTNDAVVGVATTTATGYYLFTNLPPTNYLVIVGEDSPYFPPFYVCTADPFGAKDGISLATIVNSNRLDQDFGYRPYGYGTIGDFVWYDNNGDGLQDYGEEGISNITVTLYVDANGDSNYVYRQSLTTDVNGLYLFTNLPDATYKVVVSTNDTDLPTDSLGYFSKLTTTNQYVVTIVTNSIFLDADFGFVLPGAIGDTVYWDYNENASQDWNEPGVTGVTVELYYDVNGNRVYDDGTDVYYTNDVTDEEGMYLFEGLWPTNYIVVVDTKSQPLTNAVLTADPDNGGLPCSDPSVTNCDSAYAYPIDYGEIFLGADFGYLPPGVIGDLVWLDQNDNGVRDNGEAGLPWIEVWLYTNGTLLATNETDADGWYAFGNLMDGRYRVVVNTNDIDFPTNLYPNWDYDWAYGGGSLDSQIPEIWINNGTVTSIAGVACTECNLDVDFGYRLPGTNILSGTVGIDAQPFDGLMGTTGSGYSSNEAPFAEGEVIVHLWFWTDDDHDHVVDDGETFVGQPIGSTVADAIGDYSFTGMPTGDTNQYYIVSLAAPRPHLIMTTTNGSTTALSVVNTTNAYGETKSAYQTLTIQPVTTNIDFAFTWTFAYDFGDLPDSYSTLIQALPAGAQNQVAQTTTNLYLGATVDVENNGQPSANADGDGDDEDGVDLPLVIWQNGSDGGSVQVTVGLGEGWLTGYIDFDQDGSFLDFGEMVADQAVSTGVYTFAFSIPSNTISDTTSTVLYARFRLFEDKPFISQLAYASYVDPGEVEDYRWELGALGNFVWEDANSNGTWQSWEPLITGVTVFADVNTNGALDTGEPYRITGTNAEYWIGGFPAGTFIIRVDTSTIPSEYFATYDLDGGADNVTTVTLASAEINTNVDFGYRKSNSTYAVVTRFDAAMADGQAVVEWDTASEIGTAGFDLYRQGAGGEYVKVNSEFVPGMLDSPQGGTYRLVDPTARPGATYSYELVETECRGRVNAYGPFEIVLPEASGPPSKLMAVVGGSAATEVQRTPRISELSEERRALSQAEAAASPPATKAVGGAMVRLAVGLGSSPTPVLKMLVSENGVYYLDAATLASLMGADAGEVLGWIWSRQVRIENRGAQCAYVPAEAGLYFYGQAPDSLYTSNNVYWLSRAGGTFAPTETGVPVGPQAGSTFTDVLHVEKDWFPVTADAQDPLSDYWYWNYLIAGSATLASQSYTLVPPSLAPYDGEASLVVRLLGATTTKIPQEHHVRISLNGAPIGEASWEGIGEKIITNRFSHALLVDGNNSVTVTALLDAGVPRSIVYVDAFDLSYKRRCEAVNGQLLVRESGEPAFTVSGLAGPDVRVLNVSNPLQPAVHVGVMVDFADGAWRGSFSAAPSRSYQVFAAGSGRQPGSIAADAASDLRSAANAAEYLVITVPQLQVQAQALADYRQGKGLSSKVVLLGDIYDEFNHGLAEPPAIKTFLQYAASTWTVPPRYVVLAGEGSYDYRNWKGTDDNLLPVVMVAAPRGLFASDGWYADLNDDLVPEMAVGRLPVLTGSELAGMVSRIIAYESGEGGQWKQDLVLTADNPDFGGDFPTSSEGVKPLLPRDYGTKAIYLSELGTAQTRSQLLGAINRGAVFVNYFGHGALDVWAGERMLRSTDIAALSNGMRRPVVVSLTCSVGQFALPGFDCLSEVLVLGTGGGAMAVWSPTGLSENPDAEELAREFYFAVFRAGQAVLGDAILMAMREALAAGQTYMLKIYNLLGDPAMKLEGVAFAGPAYTLQRWQGEAFTDAELADPAGGGAWADPEGDGDINLMEYAMGWNPHAADANSRLSIEGPWEVILGAGGEAAVSYQRRKGVGDVEYQLQTSQDLVNWTAADACVTGVAVLDDANGVTETVQTTMVIPPQMAGRQLFARLLVVLR